MLISQQKITVIAIFLTALLLVFAFFITGQYQQPIVTGAGNESGTIPALNISQNETTGSGLTARPLWQYTYPSGDGVQAVSVDRNGNAIVAGTRFSDLYYFNRTGTAVWYHEGTRDPEAVSIIRRNPEGRYGLNGVTASADGNYTGVVSASGQNAYYYQNGTPVLGGEWASVYSGGQNVATSDDGRYFVAGIGYGNNNNVLFYDLQHLNPHFYRGGTNHETWHYTTYNSVGASGIQNPSPDPHDPAGVHVAICADGKYVAAVSEDSRVYYFNQSGSLLWSNITGRSLENVAMSADGQYVAAASRDHNVYYFNATGSRLWIFTTGNVVKSVAVTADGQYIAAGSDDSNIYLLEKDGTLRWKYSADGPVETVAMSRDGNTIAAGSDDNSLYCFDQSGTLLWNYTTGGKVKSVAVSGDGKYVAAGSEDGNVYFFDRKGESSH
jgi:WD40 repeat protein